AERLIVAEREIEQSLLRQCGLTAIVRLRLDGVEAAPAPDIDMDVEARVADYPYPIKLHAKVLTEVRARERGRVFEAMRRKPSPDLKAMTAWACQAALENLGVAQVRIGLHGDVARQVRIALEPLLATCFIRVRQLTLALR